MITNMEALGESFNETSRETSVVEIHPLDRGISGEGITISTSDNIEAIDTKSNGKLRDHRGVEGPSDPQECVSEPKISPLSPPLRSSLILIESEGREPLIEGSFQSSIKVGCNKENISLVMKSPISPISLGTAEFKEDIRRETKYTKVLASHFKIEEVINRTLPLVDDEPFFIVDLRSVKEQVLRWRKNLPDIDIRYAVKCNPNMEILRLLHKMGCGFDCASKEELKLVLSLENSCSVCAGDDSMISKGDHHIVDGNYRNNWNKSCITKDHTTEDHGKCHITEEDNNCFIVGGHSTENHSKRCVVEKDTTAYGFIPKSKNYHTSCNENTQACDKSGSVCNLHDSYQTHNFNGKVHITQKNDPDRNPTVLDVIVQRTGHDENPIIPNVYENLNGNQKRHKPFSVDREKIVYANPCKHISHIKYARDQGIRYTTLDNHLELEKLHTYWPEVKSLIRIATDDSNSKYRLSAKFGAEIDETEIIFQRASTLKMEIVGVAFHVGSQCQDPLSYRKAVEKSRRVMDLGKSYGFSMDILDIGGGFPGDKSQMFENMAREATKTIGDNFTSDIKLIGEPGRYLSRMSHTLVTQVIGKKVLRDYSSSSFHNSTPIHDPTLTYDSTPTLTCDSTSISCVTSVHNIGSISEVQDIFAYTLNDGVYQSFNNIVFDSYLPIYKIYDEKLRGSREPQQYPSTFFGPTCDCVDTISKGTLIRELNIGDVLYFDNFGSYVSCCSTVGFNGFQTSKYFYIPAV